MIRKLGSCLFLVALGALAGCSGTTGNGKSNDASGTIRLEAAIAPGIDIDEVSYSIAVPGNDAITGSLSVAEDGTVSGALESVPAAKGVKISLTASGSSETTCAGDGTVDVEAGETVSVSIVLQCRLADGTPVTTGGISVKASFNVCPQVLTASAAAPSEGSIAVKSTADDLDEDALTYEWSAESGSFADAAAASTTYTCEDDGKQTLTLTVTDADGCSHSKDVEVTCSAAPPVDAGTPADSGASADSGTPAADSGTPSVDSGTPAADSGTPAADSGTPAADSGTPPADSGAPTDGGGERPWCGDPGSTPANACEECACTSCADEMAACAAIEGTAAAGPAAGDAKADLCKAVVRCGQDNGCRSDACFLGTTADGAVDTAAILMPHGPCVDAILAAAEAASPIDVVTRREDASFALSFASAISNCSVDSCAEACGN